MRRAEIVAASLLAAGYLLFSGVYSHRAPVGSWENQIFGLPAWTEFDPGGFYVAAAHQLQWGEAPIYVGHPGSTLLVLLLGVQRAYYTLAGPDGYAFTEFTARHLPTVFFLSKLMMTALHLVSFWALFAFSERLLRSRRAALFAVLGYGTSLPVLFFLSRLSVEPLMVSFFLASFLAIWRYQDLAAEGRVRTALAFAGLAAAAAVSGAVTKFNFLGPLPFFLLVYLLLGARREPAGDCIGWRLRGQALLAFACVGVAVAILYSGIIDWSHFFAFWRTVARWPRSVEWGIGQLLPARTPRGAFVLSEWAFIAAGTAGWVLFLLRLPGRRSRALWVSAYAGWCLLLWAYRLVRAGDLLPFHYFLPGSVVVAVFFGYFTQHLVTRLPFRATGWRVAVFTGAWLIAIHGVGAWVAVDSRRNDVAAFAPNRAIYDLIARLEPSERLGFQDRRGRGRLHSASLPVLSGIPAPARPTLSSTSLLIEFEALFTPVEPGSVAPDTQRLFVPALKADVVVLDMSDDRGG